MNVAASTNDTLLYHCAQRRDSQMDYFEMKRSSAKTGQSDHNLVGQRDEHDNDNLAPPSKAAHVDQDSCSHGDASRSPTRVRFGQVQTREFAVTVGAMSGMKDTCPITLDWEYRERRAKSLPSDKKDRSRSSKLRKLSLSERRDLVARVQGINSVDVRRMELSMIMSQCRSAMKEIDSTLAVRL